MKSVSNKIKKRCPKGTKPINKIEKDNNKAGHKMCPNKRERRAIQVLFPSSPLKFQIYRVIAQAM
jgi:hypothetical protein